MEKEDCLYVGGDDSNHAGTSKGEIIVATFSSNQQDSVVRDFKNVRDRLGLEDWISRDDIDYRFTLLTSERFRHSSQNLVFAIPSLIRAYLDQTSQSFRNLKVYLDGPMSQGVRDYIRNYFVGKYGIENVVVDNFIKKHQKNFVGKKRRVEKHQRCPPLVYYADVLANR